MEYLFSNCSSLLTISDILNWKTDNLKKMANMFDEYKSLILLPDISKWNISKIENKQDILSLFSFQQKDNSISNSLIYNKSLQNISHSLSNKVEKEKSTAVYTYAYFNNYFNIYNSNDEELNDYYENFFN